MNPKVTVIVKWSILVLCWLLFSPLFYWLAGKWGMVSKVRRIWLSIFSPNMFILIWLLFLLFALFVWYMVMLYNSRDMVHIYEDSERLKRITGVAFPEFALVEYKKGETNWMGDYEDTFILEMDEELSEATYHHLDSVIECGDAYWGKDGIRYWYRNSWGNGEPTPEGEDPRHDHFLEIDFEKGNRIVNLRWGMW